MKRVVGLLHRQAVKAKAEGLFFKACCASHLNAGDLTNMNVTGLHL